MLDGALCMRFAESSRRVLLLLLLVALEDVEQEGGLASVLHGNVEVSRVTPWHAKGIATALKTA